MKHEAEFYTGWTPPTGDAESFEGDNLWANISDLGPKVLIDTAKRISDKAVRRSAIRVSPAESVLFSFKLSIGQVSFAGRDMYTNEAIATFPPQPGLNTRWAYWAFPVFIPLNAGENIYGAKLLNQELIRSADLLVPPVEEQTRIANFLDDKTARIDALIAEKERLVTTIEELWEAKLKHAMQVPALVGGKPLAPGWTNVSLKRLCSTITTGRTPSGSRDDCFSDDGRLWVTPGDIQGLFVEGSARRVTDIAVSDDEVREYPAGATLLVGIGATVGNVGHAVLKTSANQQINILIPDEKMVDPMFLTLLVEAHREQIRLAAGAATLPIINQEKTGRIEVAIPELRVQESLREALLSAKGHIEELKTHVNDHIDRLREYRSSLISAAVTGQLDLSTTTVNV